MNIFKDIALPLVLIFEGDKFTEIKNDKGGATKYGVTQKVYDGYRINHRLPKQLVKDITMTEVEIIYYTGYWQPNKCDKFGEATSISLLDTGVNCGTGRAAKFLQKSLGVKQDGIIGGATISKSQQYQDIVMARLFLMERTKFYQNIVKNDKTQEKFLKGWIRRVTYLSDYISKNKTLEQIKESW